MGTTNILSSKLLKLLKKEEFLKVEEEIEKLGKITDQPKQLVMLYATAKALKKNTSHSDLKLAAKLFENVYRSNNFNLEAFNNLINISLRLKNFDYVYPHLKKRIKIEKNNEKILYTLIRAYQSKYNLEKAFEYSETLTKIRPNDPNSWIIFLSIINYLNKPQEFYFDKVKKFNNSSKLKYDDFSLNQKQKNKIRLGFLSADFKEHSITYFVKDFVKQISKDRFDIVAFNNMNKKFEDKTTEELRSSFNEWYDTKTLTDLDFVKFIRSKQIDVLIDLIGLTNDNRVNALRLRCAAIQISWLGYCNSLGIDTMDFLIADHNLIKKNEEKLYSEKIIYMPNIWNVMSKRENLPKINSLPAKKNSFFTFGSFNNFLKISNENIRVWSEILMNSNSRLLLKSGLNYNLEIQKDILEKFKKYKLKSEKIIFINKINLTIDHLKKYNDIDLSLDTFPYPGVTTSFESLLMGVPVLTMNGFNFNSRCGVSINTNLGLENFIAKNENDYVTKAINFVKQPDYIAELRENLREKVLGSPLFDVKTFTNDFTSKILEIYNDKFLNN